MSDAAFLIAGAGGMLGTALQQVLTRRDLAFRAPGEHSFDITDPVAVRHTVRDFSAAYTGRRLVLVNAAAYTNVERAEDEPEVAYLVNEQGPVNLARAAREAGMEFVHVSTDFVFDGTKDGAYTEDDEPRPLSVYGASKLAGEVSLRAEKPDSLIVRTAWVFAPAGANFPLKVLSAAREKDRLRVVTDEVGSPTFTADLAGGILGLVEADARGLLHLTASGSCTRHELACEVLRLAGLRHVVVEPVSSAAFPTKARRPKNSVLDCGKAAELGVVLPSWQDGLSKCMMEVLASEGMTIV